MCASHQLFCNMTHLLSTLAWTWYLTCFYILAQDTSHRRLLVAAWRWNKPRTIQAAVRVQHQDQDMAGYAIRQDCFRTQSRDGGTFNDQGTPHIVVTNMLYDKCHSWMVYSFSFKAAARCCSHPMGTGNAIHCFCIVQFKHVDSNTVKHSLFKHSLRLFKHNTVYTWIQTQPASSLSCVLCEREFYANNKA